MLKNTHKLSFIVVFNGNSGEKQNAADFKKLLEKYYPSPAYSFEIIEISEKMDLAKELEKAKAKTNNFAISGGDGTVRECIQHLAENSQITVTVIPSGSMNHFAKDLGQSLNIEEAIQSIMNPHSQLVDVGKVNDFYYVNQSSIGLYPSLARHKQKWRQKGVGRLIATIVGTFKALAAFKSIKIAAEVNKKNITKESLLIFIGNNKYNLQAKQTTPQQIAKRDDLNQHRLHFFILKKVSRLRLFSMIFHSLMGNLKQQDEFEEYFTDQLTIDSAHSKKSTTVSLDGEVYQMNFPLKYQIIPDGLKVKVFSS
ncbi:MAG: diacylglycerol/lipid kinase family protein, partial [Candidatus Altimarinota bacterium]